MNPAYTPKREVNKIDNGINKKSKKIIYTEPYKVARGISFEQLEVSVNNLMEQDYLPFERVFKIDNSICQAMIRSGE